MPRYIAPGRIRTFTTLRDLLLYANARIDKLSEDGAAPPNPPNGAALHIEQNGGVAA